MSIRKLRIHGDNIVECERTLKMLIEAYKAECVLMSSPIYFPKYKICTDVATFEIELLSGHGRWSGINLGEIVRQAGARLRESADSYITEIVGDKEKLLLGIEYCSALPAGNNAWQRNGRAWASVYANVPYLYYAEIGGIELDENRKAKAPRYPNPAVPFSYVALSYDMKCVCLPVYRPHPSMTNENFRFYKNVFGYEDGLVYIRQLIDGEDTTRTVSILSQKALEMVKLLSSRRKRIDTLRGEEWDKLLTSSERIAQLASFKGFAWNKKTSEKVMMSSSFLKLKAKVESFSPKPISAEDLPFCIVPKKKLQTLKSWLKNSYKGFEVDFDTTKDLAIVWITGFKPRGDDSRPDRGLSPLCRMILGENANIMAVVYGPAKGLTWNLLLNDRAELVKSNGLFQAIFECCNYLLVDSVTSARKFFISTEASFNKNQNAITFDYIETPTVSFFEHDTDCAIHQIMSAKEEMDIFECFCNPPGGDWSGISYFENDNEYKWTSLPRVSKQSKRPDHIFQIKKGSEIFFVPIESKGLGIDLEDNIGDRLKDYINDLFKSEPTAFRTTNNPNWRFFGGNLKPIKYKQISVGAFLYRNNEELPIIQKRGNLDAVFAFEFGEKSILHVLANQNGQLLIAYLKEIASKQGGFVVKVH